MRGREESKCGRGEKQRRPPHQAEAYHPSVEGNKYGLMFGKHFIHYSKYFFQREPPTPLRSNGVPAFYWMTG